MGHGSKWITVAQAAVDLDPRRNDSNNINARAWGRGPWRRVAQCALSIQGILGVERGVGVGVGVECLRPEGGEFGSILACDEALFQVADLKASAS